MSRNKSQNSGGKPHQQGNGEQTDKVKAKKRKNDSKDKLGDSDKVKKRKFDPSSAKAIQLKFKAKFNSGKRQKKKFGKKEGQKAASKVQSES